MPPNRHFPGFPPARNGHQPDAASLTVAQPINDVQILIQVITKLAVATHGAGPYPQGFAHELIPPALQIFHAAMYASSCRRLNEVLTHAQQTGQMAFAEANRDTRDDPPEVSSAGQSEQAEPGTPAPPTPTEEEDAAEAEKRRLARLAREAEIRGPDSA